VARAHVFVTALLVLAALPGVGGSASAQDVKWRTDYTAARKEAAETGRPLLLDFGTESCFWCKKLDSTTFRDPKVVKLLNERFIPVKIDAQKYQQLAAALKIEGYPTLILATADGKVIDRHSGYIDATEFTALLNKVPAPVASKAPPPAPPKPLTKDEIDAGLAALFPEIAAALDR
jgi:thioredoxin-related protein